VFAACPVLLCACGSQSADNGIASQSPARALARVESAAAEAATVHMAGSVAGPAGPLAIGMELVRGEGARGTIAVGGLQADLEQVDGWVYVKPNPPLLRRLVGPVAAPHLAGRWLKGPAGHGPLAPLASLTDLRTVLLGTLSSHRALRTAGVRSVAGHPAVALQDTASGATLYVSATGTPYPLVLVRPGHDGGRLTFDRWNQAVSLEAPANPLNIKAVFSLKAL
jgi:hypothetical protein